MDSNILKIVNRHLKNQRPMFPDDKICSIFITHQLVEIGFLSKRCRNDQAGACIMCDYGAAEQTYTVRDYLTAMETILNSIPSDVQRLLLCTNGSFLDESQISAELFVAILKKTAETSIPNIEIETHYLDITEKKLDKIKTILVNKKITIEMGLETTNPLYQDKLFMKQIEITHFEKTIELIQSKGILVDLNIIFGMPLLTLREQIIDAQKTIMWSCSHGCYSVIFPINIKSNTLLGHMYRSGYYTPVSHWAFLYLLNLLNSDILQNITLAWYGNREDQCDSEKSQSIFPQSCPCCRKGLTDFYDKFMKNYDGKKRKRLLQEMLSHPPCDCLEKVHNLLKEEGVTTFEKRFDSYLGLLRKDFGDILDAKEKLNNGY